MTPMPRLPSVAREGLPTGSQLPPEVDTARQQDRGAGPDGRDAEYLDLFEEGPVAYFSTSRDGRIRMANRRAARLTRYELDELVGMPVLDLYADAPAGVRKARALFEQFRHGESISGEELLWRRGDGTTAWIQLWVRPITDEQGTAVASRSVAIDISNRKAAERERTQAVAEREEAVASERRFLSMLSHELRTPLGSLKGFAELLVTRRQHLSEDQREQMTQRMLDTIDRMSRLVDEFLQLSQQEGVQPRRESVDLARHLHDTATHLHATEDIRIEVSDDLVVPADPLLLHQIITNLLANAIRHGAPPVEISAHRRDDGGAEVSVRDHGPGVPEDFAPDLFGRFAQAEPAAGGSGLGLSIARELARAHGGDLTHEPADPGSRFTLRLPRPDAQSED